MPPDMPRVLCHAQYVPAARVRARREQREGVVTMALIFRFDDAPFRLLRFSSLFLLFLLCHYLRRLRLLSFTIRHHY